MTGSREGKILRRKEHHKAVVLVGFSIRRFDSSYVRNGVEARGEFHTDFLRLGRFGAAVELYVISENVN